MPLSKDNDLNILKRVVALVAFFAFLVASIVVACNARHYQLLNQPMPNSKGGFMSPGDGYMVAIILLLFSVASLVIAYKSFIVKNK